jgi:hypothetical protein
MPTRIVRVSRVRIGVRLPRVGLLANVTVLDRILNT